MTNKDNFVHLHLHTEYSALDGFIRIKDIKDDDKKVVVQGLASKLRELKQKSCAITDHGSLSGIHECLEHFTVKKEENGKQVIDYEKSIKLIPGYEAYIVQDRHNKTRKSQKVHHLLLLVETEEGWKNLLKLNFLAYKEGRVMSYDRVLPRIDREILRKHSKGLICCSACLAGEIPFFLNEGDKEKAIEFVKLYQDIFGVDNFYLEIQPVDYEYLLDREDLLGEIEREKERIGGQVALQKNANREIIELAEELNVPLVITTDSHYLNRDERDAHQLLLAMQSKSSILSSKRLAFEASPIKSSEDLLEDFKEYPKEKVNEWIENTNKINEKCQNPVEYLMDKQYKVPKFPVPVEEEGFKKWIEGWTDNKKRKLVKRKQIDEYLRREIFYFRYKCEIGIEKLLSRIKKLPKWARERGIESVEDLHEVYRKRMEEEFETIKKMGFPAYFLIIADIVDYCKENKIPVGPGRGSAAGCLCSYLLGITKIDSIRYHLLFSRFLNPARVSMPDIDMDYSREKRHLIKEYLANKYGIDRVASICTFGRLKVRAAIKDIVKSMNLGGTISSSFKLADEITKTLEDYDDDISYKDALSDPKFAKYMKEYPKLASSVMRYEGLVRQTGMHAAGVLISSKNFDEEIPMMVDKNNVVLTAYEGTTLESLGYLKLDVLGLKTLDVEKGTYSNVEKISREKPTMISLTGIPVADMAEDDHKTFAERYSKAPEHMKKASKAYQLLRRGDTLGVFQCELPFTQNLLRQIRANSIEDISATLALIRPGPRRGGLTSSYAKRKMGEEDTKYGVEINENSDGHIVFRVKGTEYRIVDPETNKQQKIKLDENSKLKKKIEIANTYFEEMLCLKADLRETYGVPTFQEQLMRISVNCAGFSESEADDLRKAVGKKIPEKMDKIRPKFVKGMIQGKGVNNPGGVSSRAAESLWGLFVRFGEYGFNASHSVSYAMIAYRTAWLKANYPAEFWSAVLSNEKEQIKINSFLKEVINSGIIIHPANVNKSTLTFDVVDKNSIRRDLVSLKGLGNAAVQKIMSNRPYKNMVEFIYKSGVNKTAIEALIKAGAFDHAFEDEKISRKIYYDFYGDARTKIKRQIDRLLKDDLIKRYTLEHKKEKGGPTKDEWFRDQLEENALLAKSWEDGKLQIVSEFQYDWNNPTNYNKKTKKEEPVERKSGDDRDEWSMKEIIDFEKEIYGMAISGHEFDEYKKIEENFKKYYNKQVYNLGTPFDNYRANQVIYAMVKLLEGGRASPYKKDKTKYTYRLRIEDRYAEDSIIMFHHNFHDDRNFPALKYGVKHDISGTVGGGGPILILECIVNEYMGRKGLKFKSLKSWVNKDEFGN